VKHLVGIKGLDNDDSIFRVEAMAQLAFGQIECDVAIKVLEVKFALRKKEAQVEEGDLGGASSFFPSAAPLLRARDTIRLQHAPPASVTACPAGQAVCLGNGERESPTMSHAGWLLIMRDGN
jgi:hypothetical protein